MTKQCFFIPPLNEVIISKLMGREGATQLLSRGNVRQNWLIYISLRHSGHYLSASPWFFRTSYQSSLPCFFFLHQQFYPCFRLWLSITLGPSVSSSLSLCLALPLCLFHCLFLRVSLSVSVFVFLFLTISVSYYLPVFLFNFFFVFLSILRPSHTNKQFVYLHIQLYFPSTNTGNEHVFFQQQAQKQKHQ